MTGRSNIWSRSACESASSASSRIQRSRSDSTMSATSSRRSWTELRDLAHGLYPPVLREFGLREALASVVRRSASPVKLEAAAIGRYSEDEEAAVYFCCVEGLQNVAKHAGSGATAVIRLWERDGRL